MENMNLHDKSQTLKGAALLRLAVNIASHPVWAGYTPAGPGALATGQGGLIRGGRGAGPAARATRSPPGFAGFGGPGGGLDCPGC